MQENTTKKSGGKRGRKLDAGSKSGQIRELLKTGMSASDIAKKLGCTPALVYNVKARTAGGGKRGPGRPKASPAASSGSGISGSGIESIVVAVRQAELERGRLRAALEKIQAVLHEVLG
jgi:transposase-like protein